MRKSQSKEIEKAVKTTLSKPFKRRDKDEAINLFYHYFQKREKGAIQKPINKRQLVLSQIG